MLFPTNRAPTHPGEFIREDFLPELSMTPSDLADRIARPLSEVSALLRGEVALNAEYALLISEVLSMPPTFLMKVQANYDLWVAHRHLKGLTLSAN